MMDQRFLGGEAGHRSLWGTSTKKTRNVALALVGVVGLFLVPVFSTPALAGVVLAWAAVFVATTQTHTGTPWERWSRGRQWRERQRAGTTRFRPVERRPAELHAEYVGGSRRGRAEVATEWNSYRDWADGAEGMSWLLAKPRVPGIAWHAPTGEDPWLTVVFPLTGQVSGIQGDEIVNARSRAFGRLLSVFGSANALARRIQIITHVQPVDTAAHEAWVAREVDPEAPEELLRSYKEVITRLGGGGLMQRHYAVVRWPLTTRFLHQARRQGPGQVGWIKLMGQEIDSIWREMNAAKLGPGRALSAAQTAAVLRHLQMPSWPIDQAGDVDPQRMWLPSEDEWSYTRVTDAGPDGVQESWLHRTAVVPITSVETAARDALWMMPLLAQLPKQRVVRTISVQLEGVTQQLARSQARDDLTSDLAEVSAQRSKGTLLDDELLEGVDAARARVGDLRPGKGHQGLAWVMHVTVSAQSVSELRSGCELMAEAAGKAGIGDLRWLDAHQGAAQACTWPLARGMKPVPTSAGMRVTGALAGTGPKEALT
jgi:hypothetical protein